MKIDITRETASDLHKESENIFFPNWNTIVATYVMFLILNFV